MIEFLPGSPDEPSNGGADNAFDADLTDSAPSEQQIVTWLDQLWQADVRRDALQGQTAPFEVGSYTAHQIVGQGAFGVVYRATDERSSREVALKIPRPEVLLCGEKLKRFEGEARAAARLEHPGIVPLYEAELDGPIPYIASAFCSGPDLSKWLEAHPQDTPDCRSAVQFVLKVAQAIEHAHAQGVVHRDIKPSNIMLAPCDPVSMAGNDDLARFSPRLTDFGLAKLTDAALTHSRSSWILGTPYYMAPEQLLPNWGPVGERADIFAIGALLWELLQGEPPRAGQTYTDMITDLLRERSSQPRPRPELPEDLQLILARCLAKDQAERYASASALAQDLQAFLDGKPIAARRFTWLDAVSRWAAHPQRPYQICFFVIPFNLVMAVWMVFCAAAMGALLPASDRSIDIIQAVAIGVGYCLPLAGLCMLRLQGQRWATQLALALTLMVTVVVPSLALGGILPSFTELYRDAHYFGVINHAQVLLFGLTEAFLLAVSVYADIQQSRRTTDEQGQEKKPA